MAYTTPALIQAYLGLEDVDYDLLLALSARSKKVVDTYTGRTFEAPSATAQARNFTVGVDTVGRMLYLDEDLCAISEVMVDADGDETVLAAAEYITHPRNATPYHAIEIKQSSDYWWEYSDDPADGIKITGTWSFSAAAGDDIIQAATRLAAYFYRQRDAQVFDVTAIPDAGVMTIPQGIPADVKIMLDPYRKLAL